ncbi:hypothetical protein GCM10027446_29990 [Angustibacter peucedani]
MTHRRTCLLAATTLLALTACGGSGSDDSASSSTTTSTSTGTGTGTGTSSTAPTASATSTTSSAPTGSTPAASPVVERCHTSQVSARVVPGSPGAGQRHATLELRNTSEQTCTLHGYGGMQLVSSSDQQLATDVERVPSPVRTVTLRPGGAARSQLQWGAVPGEGDAPSGDCQPEAHRLWVTPPDERDHAVTSWTLGPVCEQGRIEQRPWTA